MNMNAGFSVASTTSFRVSVPKFDRDRLRVGLGKTGQFNEKTTLAVGYFCKLADSHDIHIISASVRILCSLVTGKISIALLNRNDRIAPY
jgi:hypothetical protein